MFEMCKTVHIGVTGTEIS